MSGQPVLIAVDLGTTSCRAFAFAPDGRVLGQAGRSYPLRTPGSGRVEQDPAELLAAADAAVPAALAQAGAGPGDVLGLVLSTYLHGLGALDARGAPLTPVLTWADGRAAPQADAMRARPDWAGLAARTGCPPHPMYPLYKLRWLREERPDLWSRAAGFADPKSLLIRHWTGEWALDHSVASATGLVDVSRLDWDPGALAWAGVDPSRLPALVPPTTALPLLREAAARLGLRAGTPVVVGAGDGMLANLGSGAIEPGVLAATVGTSAALRAVLPVPRTDPRARLWCYHLAPGRYVLGGSLSSGGMVLAWVRDRLYAPDTPYETLLAEAAAVPPGAGGLLFLPYLSGERSPGFNARMRGVWFGLGLEHGRGHLVRSALEGIAFRLASVLEPLEELAGPAREVRAAGGLARSPLWLSVCADVLGREVAVPDQVESTALGAFVLGGVALGLFPGLEAVHRFVGVRERVAPDPDRHAHYRELFDLYRRVDTKVREEFDVLARLRARHPPGGGGG
ncbi:gluconokinase [Caldinitratiruptor microaerophilus]|uniref:Chaperone protein DnaK n=1 Tax=Caldinitratiruptor microaerophilus TaxID=671077 RepID=A0AA35CHS4_9FIRM|nr:gluconokinase [Caldinitratiruptor microaerophilus]BDG59137.1 gluconate kinase [Caldinitratiruptor microaerophilus]